MILGHNDTRQSLGWQAGRQLEKITSTATYRGRKHSLLSSGWCRAAQRQFDDQELIQQNSSCEAA